VEENLIIRKATEKETDSLLKIWKEKEKSLEAKGIPVWDIKQFTKENLKQKYACPEYFIAIIGGEIIGGFILIEKDIHFWPNNTNDKSYYFHNFVIRDKYSGKGYSKSILDWVKNYGKGKGKEFIRLDFNEKREYLKGMYYGNGFKKVEVIMEDESNRIVLAEYRINMNKE